MRGDQPLLLMSSGLGVYHGYTEHNGNLGWTAAWGLLGYTFPAISTGLILIQWFLKKEITSLIPSL